MWTVSIKTEEKDIIPLPPPFCGRMFHGLSVAPACYLYSGNISVLGALISKQAYVWENVFFSLFFHICGFSTDKST